MIIITRDHFCGNILPIVDEMDMPTHIALAVLVFFSENRIGGDVVVFNFIITAYDFGNSW